MAHLYAYIKKYFPILRWVLLFFLITWWWRFSVDKTVFLLDYVPTPIYTRDRSNYLSDWLIRIVHDALIYLIWHTWWSKIYLAAIFFWSVWLGFSRGKWILNEFFKQNDTIQSRTIIAISMTLFVANPFFSGRFGTQPGIWLSSMLIGWWVFFLVSNRWNIKRTHCIGIGILWWLAVSGMPHASFMIVALLWTLLLCNPRMLLSACFIGLTALIINTNRIFFSWGNTIHTVSNNQAFDSKNIDEFKTYHYQAIWPISTAALWYWFRWEKYGSAYTPTKANNKRRVAWSCIICFALFGIRSLYRKQNNTSLVRRIGSMLLISLVLWIGISSDLLARITNRLYEYVPWYRWLREPHKRIGIYIMFLLPLVSIGWGKSTAFVKRFLPTELYALAFLMVLFARTPGVIGAMRWRYIMTQYPENYQQTRLKLMDSFSGTLVQFPRHSYHQCNRTQKIIANTLSRYFLPANVIVSDNIEIGNLYTNSSSQRSKDIEMFLTKKDATLLTKHSISWILFMKQCANYKAYNRLEKSSILDKVIETTDIAVYSIKK